MNKTMKIWMLAAILFLSGTIVNGCKCKTSEPQPEEQAAESTEVQEEVTYLTAVNAYLTNEIGKNYASAEYCIPCLYVVNVDEQDDNDIRVLGDFWVYNYNRSGDTLKCVSGGNHPGLMHLRKTDNGFEVTGFDQVEDGARNLASAKRIFGEYFETFSAIQSDKQKREEERTRIIADYVKKHKLPVTMYQDYGWPAVKLP